MVFTQAGAQFVAWTLGGSSFPNPNIGYIEAGYGSGTALVTNVTLVNGSIRTGITPPISFPIARTVNFQADFSVTQISGLTLREFGLFSVSGVNTGSAWQRESFNGVTFDGTNELQISSTLEVIPG